MCTHWRVNYIRDIVLIYIMKLSFFFSTLYCHSFVRSLPLSGVKCGSLKNATHQIYVLATHHDSDFPLLISCWCFFFNFHIPFGRLFQRLFQLNMPRDETVTLSDEKCAICFPSLHIVWKIMEKKI